MLWVYFQYIQHKFPSADQRLPKGQGALRLTVVSVYQISGKQFSRVIGSSNWEVPTWNTLGYRAFSYDVTSADLLSLYVFPNSDDVMFSRDLAFVFS